MTTGKAAPPLSATRKALGKLSRLEAQSRVRDPLSFALGKLTETSSHKAAIFFEMFALSLITILIGLVVNPDNPLWIEASFPWTWFAPVIIALRYGPLSGLGSAGMILVAWLLLNNTGDYDSFPKGSFLGGLILVMLVGEFSSIWLTKYRRAETLQLYLDHRLEYLTRQYYILRLSHDRLEQDLISRPMSMRDALKTLQGIGTSEDLSKSSTTLLKLIAQYCQIENAQVFRLEKGQIVPDPVARLGTPSEIDLKDPLIIQAMETGKLCHVSQSLRGENTATMRTRYVIAAPLINLNQDQYGLLVVEDMPFFSLQEESLQTINLLIGYYTDGLATMTLAKPVLDAFPDAPPEFAFEIQRMWHIRKRSDVTSVVVALEMHTKAIERDIPQQVMRMKRQLDELWLMKGSSRQIVLTLMPLADASTAEGYLNRIEGWAKQLSGESLSGLGIYGHVLVLDSDSPLDIIGKLRDIANA